MSVEMTSLRLVKISVVFSAVLAYVLLISSPAHVQGYDETITIEPATPTEEDFVRIGITGLYSYSTGCSTTSGQYGSVYPESASYSISGQTITIQVLWTFAVGACNADSNEGSYGFTFDIGPLAAGDYIVEAYGVEPYGDEFATASFTVTPDPDDDNDAWLDTAEGAVGTDPLDACADTATPNDERGPAFSEPVPPWPPDFNDDRSVTGADLSAVAAVIGQSVPTAPVRRDIGQPPDGAITGADLSAVAGNIGLSCTP